MKCCWCELGEQDCRLQISRNCNIKHYVVQGYNENDGRIISSKGSVQKRCSNISPLLHYLSEMWKYNHYISVTHRLRYGIVFALPIKSIKAILAI